MAHFAKIDEDGTVLEVIATSNQKPGEGYYWLVDTFGGTWLKTSYNTQAGVHRLGGTPLRKNFAGVGFTYDEERDAFIPPQPFASWLLDENTCNWNPPTPYPSDGKFYDWDEESLSWVEVIEEETAE